MKSLKMMISVAGIAALIAGCSVESPMTSQGQVSPPAPEPVISKNAADPGSKAVLAGSSVSLAHSYETLEELEEASVLIAEVSIKDVLLTDKENDSSFYNATVTDVLKGTVEEKEIVLTQVGVEEEREKTGELKMERENPLMKVGDSYILFLKAGKDDRVGSLFYVAGEYQGKYQIQGEQVYSVNQKAQTKATISGESVDQFKEKIRELVETTE